jgi:tetratricopeptide (TPR) repeat protein
VVLVDSSRDFEKACQLIKEITPDNFSAIRYIKPDGEILPGLTDDLEEAAKKALEGAEWKVNANIPDSLKGTWMAVEIGNFKGLAVPLKKAVASSKPDIKEAGKLLMDVVQKEMSDQMAAIKAAQEAGNPYRAYEVVNGMSEHFKGFELPKEISQLKKDLSKDQKVKNGIKAATNLEAARKHLAAGEGEKNKAYEKAIKALEEIVADYPDTALAKQAKGLLDYAK